MIVVMNRELLIPNEEFNIGTNYDNQTETRLFQIKRVTAGGVDISNLLFKLDIKYANNKTDTADLAKDVTEKEINLTLTISNNMLQVPGTVLVQIRALDEAGVQKWTSYVGAFFVEDSINTPANYTGSLTEIEKFETQELSRVNAEKERVQAELSRVNAENERVEAENNRETAFGDAIADFNNDRQELKDYANVSKSYAVGGTGTRIGEDIDNSKYYSEKSAESEANAHEYLKACEKISGVIIPVFTVSFVDGELHYNDDASYTFLINTATGNLDYQLKETT